jgi:Lsr2
VLNSLQSWLAPPRSAGVELRRLVEGGATLARAILAEPVEEPRRGIPTETVDFSYRGRAYQVDLTAREAEALDRALAPYLRSARRVSHGRPASRTASASQRPRHAAPAGHPVARDVRAWAVAQGIDVSERGRLPGDVLRRYQTAHGR